MSSLSKMTAQHPWLLTLLWLLSGIVVKSAETPYFELRLYDITTNKLTPVLERFREAVEPIRQKHGIKTIGYWTATTTNGTHLVYLMTGADRASFQRAEKAFGNDAAFQAAYRTSLQKYGQTVDKITSLTLVPSNSKSDFTPRSPARAFELRLYSILPNQLDAFRRRWDEHAVPIYQRHGIQSLGGWVAVQKDAQDHELFVCLLAGESFAGIQKSIREFHQDPEWQQVQKETEKNGPLRSGVTTYQLTPTDFSSLR